MLFKNYWQTKECYNLSSFNKSGVVYIVFLLQSLCFKNVGNLNITSYVRVLGHSSTCELDFEPVILFVSLLSRRKCVQCQLCARLCVSLWRSTQWTGLTGRAQWLHPSRLQGTKASPSAGRDPRPGLFHPSPAAAPPAGLFPEPQHKIIHITKLSSTLLINRSWNLKTTFL